MSTTLFPVPFTVTYLDGKTEVLQLGRLSIRNLYAFIHHLAGDRLPELVALVAGRPLDWIDTLTDESMAALSAKCIELNFPRAVTLGQTDPVIALKIHPLLAGLRTILKDVSLPPLSPGPKSSDSSPAVPPSASAAETPPASST